MGTPDKREQWSRSVNNPFKKDIAGQGGKRPRRTRDPQEAQRRQQEAQQRQQEFMMGRNGPDGLGRFAFIVALVIFFISFFFTRMATVDAVMSVVSLALMGYACWRMLSRDTAKRYLENARYENIMRKVKAPFARSGGARPAANPSAGPSRPSSAPTSSGGASASTAAASASGRRTKEQKAHDREMRRRYGKDFKFFECPSCGHTLRVPKGKGKVRITCPNCQTKFEGRS